MAERPEDLNLPAAVVARLMKDALPEGCNVSKEARQAVCRAASVFVLYLTSQSVLCDGYCSRSEALILTRKESWTC